MSQPGGETGIPILTEVIKGTVYGVDIPERRAQPRAPATLPDTSSTALRTSSKGGAPEVNGKADRTAGQVVDTFGSEVASTAAGATMMPHPVGADRTETGDTAALDRMVASVRAQVLQQLLDHVDVSLEQRIRDSLAETLQLAVAQLTVQLREGLQETLEALLTEAIAKELANRQISKI